MLSKFPQLLFLGPLSATIIRVSVGVAFLYAAWSRMKHADMFVRGVGILETIVAAALILGIYTQIAALIGAALSLMWLAIPKLRPLPLSTSLLVLAMCVSLLFTGAGAFAFDLPL